MPSILARNMLEPESASPGPFSLSSKREDLQKIDNQPYVPTAALQKLLTTKRNSKLAHVKLLEPKLVGAPASCLPPSTARRRLLHCNACLPSLFRCPLCAGGQQQLGWHIDWRRQRARQQLDRRRIAAAHITKALLMHSAVVSRGIPWAFGPGFAQT